MSILVTGGAGFIGSHIVDRLIECGYETIVVDNLFTGNINNINQGAKFYNVDIRDYVQLDKIFETNNIDYVIHEAAQVSVSKSMQDPYTDMSINIAGFINLLSLCKKYNIKKTVVASTAAVYGIPEYLPVGEEHRINCLSFYGLSKCTMETYLMLSGLNYLIFRYSNVYGPRQDANGEAGVISIFINRLINNNPVDIYGSGEQTRDFVYVEDVANANILAIQSDIKNEIINLSTQKEITINELFQIIKDTTNSSSCASFKHPRAGDIQDSILKNYKAKKLLNWANKVNLKKGIKMTVEWMIRQNTGVHLREECRLKF